MADHHNPPDRDNPEPHSRVVPGDLSLEQIRLEPWYKDIEDELTQPDQVTVQSKYFWKRWARILGPVATVVFLRLRQYCYFNRDTGEKRDWCWPKQESIADELGIERKTVMEALRRLEALDFIRRERQYVLDGTTNKPRRTTDKYYVKMWDPLAPEDEGAALVKAAEHLLRGSANSLERQADPYKSEKRTYRAPAVDNFGVKSEKRTHTAVRETDTKRDLQEIPNNVNVAAHSEDTELRIAVLTAELVEGLRDPKSRNFYRLVAQRMPESLVFMTLSETKDAQRTGQIRKSAGAYFTHAIKVAAERIGVDLSTRTPALAQNAALTGRKTER